MVLLQSWIIYYNLNQDHLNPPHLRKLPSLPKFGLNHPMPGEVPTVFPHGRGPIPLFQANRVVITAADQAATPTHVNHLARVPATSVQLADAEDKSLTMDLP